MTYSLDMDPATSAIPTAYQVSEGIYVTDTASPTARTVLLSTTSLAPETAYVLNVSGPTTAEGGVLQAGTQVGFRSLPANMTGGEQPPPTGENPIDGTEPAGQTPAPSEQTGDDDPTDGLPPVRGGCAAAPGLAGVVALSSLALLRRRRRRS